MRLFQQIALILDEKHLLARFWQSGSQFWRAGKAWVTALAVFLIVVTLIQLLMQILLNLWNQRLADWRSSAHRVATLLIALDELEAQEAAQGAPPARAD